MPCGRFWMNNTISTSTAIFASAAPQNGSISLADETQAEAADHRSRQLADAAQHHGHERIDDVALPEIRADVADLRERAAAESRNARAERERIRMTRAVFTPTQAAMRRFCVTARTNRPRRVFVSTPQAIATTTSENARIVKRLYGRIRFCITATPPFIHEGFVTCTFCAPNSGRVA